MIIEPNPNFTQIHFYSTQKYSRSPVSRVHEPGTFVYLCTRVELKLSNLRSCQVWFKDPSMVIFSGFVDPIFDVPSSLLAVSVSQCRRGRVRVGWFYGAAGTVGWLAVASSRCRTVASSHSRDKSLGWPSSRRFIQRSRTSSMHRVRLVDNRVTNFKRCNFDHGTR